MPRRVNGFAVIRNGRLMADSIRRSKLSTMQDWKRAVCQLEPDRMLWLWEEHAAADGLELRRVQVLIGETVAARHRGTPRKKKPLRHR